MTIDRICYDQLYPTGVYANQRYRAEATIVPGDDITECYKILKDEVEKAFVALNPQINWEEKKSIPSEINLESERISIAIENSKSQEELNSLTNEAIKHGLVEQLINKKKSFQKTNKL